ncbi:hypothetical protein [Acidocella sp.]|uniref:hypothetical protein n=1 Tax=Acidocella sp. TaxID=50710 RepID=UPI0026140F5B|nr:hypothetical protein [Acidocella sp.]
MTIAPRLAAAALLVTLAGCSSSPPPSFAPLDYSYLHPYVLKVATLNVVNNYTPGPDAQPVLNNDPVSPAATLQAMLQHRLVASGDPGTGTVTVQNASITETNGMLSGTMTVDINLQGPRGATGFAEASVSATEQAPDDLTSADGQTALYHLTKHLMDLMNVQLPYQLQHSLRAWISWTNPQAGGLATGGAMGGVIQATPLTTPAGDATTPAAPVTGGQPPAGVLGVLPVTGNGQ